MGDGGVEGPQQPPPQLDIQPVDIRPNANKGVDGETVNAQGTTSTSSVERREIDQDAIQSANDLINEFRTTIAAAREALRQVSVDNEGNPTLPEPAGSAGVGRVPDDIEGNGWFSDNALVNLRYSIIDMLLTNRETAQLFGLMEAELTALWKEMKTEEAKLTKESYQEQAKMAMYEIIGASVSIGFSVAAMGLSVAGGVKGATSKVGSPGMAASQGLNGVGQSTNQVGQSVSTIIGSSGKMIGNQELAQIEKLKILFQATAEQIRKAQDTLDKGANDALDQNDKIRQQLSKVNADFAQLFNKLTPN